MLSTWGISVRPLRRTVRNVMGQKVKDFLYVCCLGANWYARFLTHVKTICPNAKGEDEEGKNEERREF
jgi:hypothetical protein